MKIVLRKEKRFKCLEFMYLLYLTLALATTVLAYKLINIHGYDFSAASFIVPFGFSLSDIITEIYGYTAAKRIVWYGLVCEFIFVSLCYISINDYASVPNIQSAYELVFNSLPRLFISSLVAILVSSFINIFLISKWKVLIKGKYFVMRSFTSTFISLFLFTIVATMTMFVGRISLYKIWLLVINAYIFKIIMIPILSIVAGIVVRMLKKIEGLETYDDEISDMLLTLQARTKMAKNSDG